LGEKLGIHGPVAGENLLDARGQLSTRLGDGILQTLEERRLGFSE
jgi:hypothetical protein